MIKPSSPNDIRETASELVLPAYCAADGEAVKRTLGEAVVGDEVETPFALLGIWLTLVARQERSSRAGSRCGYRPCCLQRGGRLASSSRAIRIAGYVGPRDPR